MTGSQPARTKAQLTNLGALLRRRRGAAGRRRALQALPARRLAVSGCGPGRRRGRRPRQPSAAPGHAAAAAVPVHAAPQPREGEGRRRPQLTSHGRGPGVRGARVPSPADSACPVQPLPPGRRRHPKSPAADEHRSPANPGPPSSSGPANPELRSE